jgi:hypothetical protein
MPRLHEAGWSPQQIVEQYPVTDGRIAVALGGDRMLRAAIKDQAEVIELSIGARVFPEIEESTDDR